MLVALALSLGVTMGWRALFAPLYKDRDPALGLGLAGLIGLGITGLTLLFLGLIPGGLRWGPWALAALAAGRYVVGGRKWSEWRAQVPRGAGLLAPLAAGLALLFAAVGALAPSTSLDWDSLAYHLAVPKLWLAAGQIEFVSFIHHSNFPLSVDNLFLWGLALGDESTAKGFSVALFGLAILAVFGAARERYGPVAALWGVSAYATIPMAVWLSGTAYIDVAHGAFGGLAIASLARYVQGSEDRRDLILAGALLGFAAGSKYTGLQTILVALFVAAFFLVRGRGVTKLALPTALAVVIAAPWYVRNVANTGNPVYPFFYSVLGGRNWSAYNAQIYANEQQTFGAGRPLAGNYTAGPLEPLRFGHAALGLAYQPGRYINPAPTQGRGFPMGALGPVGLAALLLWLASGRARRYEAYVAGVTFGTLLLWFFLSQQSRYILTLAPPLAILAGGGIVRLPFGRALAALVPVQALLGFYTLYTYFAQDQLRVVMGQIGRDEFRRATVPFAEHAAWINGNPSEGKLALYDEVFGYLLDRPYFWANPGHTTELGYEGMRTPEDLVANLRRLGIDRVYVATGSWPREDAEALFGAPLTPERRAQLYDDLQVRWKPLLIEAAQKGLLVPEQQWGRRVLFRLSQ